MNDGKDGELEKLTAALKESEELFHAIFDLASVGIAQIGLHGGWLLLNQKICDILGYSMEELSALPLPELCRPDQPGDSFSELRRMLSGEVSSCCGERGCLRKDGSVVWVNLSTTLVRDSSQQPLYFIVVMQDVSARRRAEEELSQSEEKFRQVFRLAPVAIAVSTIEEGRFLDINEAGEKLTGYSRDQLIGHTTRELNLWMEPRERSDVVAEVLSKGEVRGREMLLRDKKGGIRWVFFSAVPIEVRGERYLLTLVNDVSDWKRAQQALRESEERFRLVAQYAPVLIWEAGPDAAVTFVNKTWLEFTGRTLEEELGEGWIESVHPEDRQRCLDTYRTAFRERREFSLEYRLRRGSGEYGWIVDSGVPRISGNGELLGYFGTGFDITEQKLAREELQQANRLLAQRVEERTAELTETVHRLQGEINERIRIGHALQDETTERLNVQAELREKDLLLVHQGRLAAMGEMIGNIAHQWRQPLNLLALITQELVMTWKRGEFDQPYLEESVGKMRETIAHMSQTIGDFSNFFKPSKEKVDFRVLETVERTISLLDGTLKAQQIRTEVIARCDPVLYGYPNELSQVLLNIMINARDALSEHRVPDPAITVEVSCAGGSCLMTVTDNGGGIPEELMDKIFWPYFTTKPPDRGTGVGLSMSRTIIEKNMGGTLRARNVEGGAQFRIELPMDAEKEVRR